MANRAQNLRVVDPVLSQLAIGYSNAEFIADTIFPMARVAKEAGKIPKFNKDHFKLYATERALRAKSNVMQPGDRTFIDVALEEHDFSVPMDYREGQEADFDLEASNAVIAEEVIRLRREKLAADLAFNPASYGAGNKVTLAGATQWSVAGSKPIEDVRAGREAVRKAIARDPNTLVIGASVMATLENHASIIERVKYSQLGVLTTELLARIFGVERVVVGKGIYVSDADVPADIWADSALLCYTRPQRANAQRSVYEPNYGYTVYKLMGEVDKYTAEGGKVQYVRNTANFKTVLVGADAGYLISDVNA